MCRPSEMRTAVEGGNCLVNGCRACYCGLVRGLSFVMPTAVVMACGTSEMIPPADPACPATMNVGDICVDGSHGSDAALGNADSAVKSLTKALDLVGKRGSGRTIYLMPARYDAANGEAFPIVIAAGITVKGTLPLAATETTAETASNADAAVVISSGPILSMQGGAQLENVIALAQGSDPSYRFVADGGIADVTLDHVYFHGGSSQVASFYVQGGTLRVRNSRLGPTLLLDAGKRLFASDSTLFSDGDAADPIMLLGSVELTNVTLRPERGGISLPGDVSAHGLTVQSSASATGRVSISGAAAALDIRDLVIMSSSLSIDSIVPQTLSNVSVTSGAIHCSDCTWQSMHASGATVTGKRVVLEDSTLGATMIRGDDRLKMRGCQIGAGSSIYVFPLGNTTSSSAFDLGTAGEAGRNTFSGDPGAHPGEPAAFLLVRSGLSFTNVLAVGNTWLPNDSGSDTTGHFPAGVIIESRAGKNLNKDSESSVTF